MKRYIPIILCVLIRISASCEDKEKSSNPNPERSSPTSEETIDSTSNESSKESQEEVKDPWVNIEGPLIVQEELIPFLTEYGKNNPENNVRIITRLGEIEVLLYNDTPLHRANFIYLVKMGYFDNTFFHRVSKNFVIQGGNSDNPDTPKKRTKIGSYLIPSEFDTGHRHTRGAFSAAKYAEQNVSKASSPYEFFIVQSDRGAHHLDNDHTVFGKVTKGMDVVDEIAKQDVGEGDWPNLNIYIKMEIID